jgi:hypothetical protein
MKIQILILFFTITISSFGQVVSVNDSIGYRGYMLILGNENHRIDTTMLDKIDPTWIKKIEVLKSQEGKNIFGNNNGIILIYPKKRFHQEINTLIKQEPVKEKIKLDYNKPQIYIDFDKKFKMANDKFAGNDTLILKHDTDSIIKSKGKYAIDSENKVSDLRFGEWFAYYENGNIKETGFFAIASYLDCGIGGLERSFYNYKIGKWTYYFENGKVSATGDYQTIKTLIDTRCEGGDSLVFGVINNNWTFYNEQGVQIDISEIDVNDFNSVLEERDHVFFIDYCYDRKENKVKMKFGNE